MRVLVVEDNVLLRAGLVQLLRVADFDVVGEAGDAETGLEALRQSVPDVVILDIRMPPTHTLEGLSLARLIRAEYGTSIGIVLLTQYVEARHAIDLLESGANGLGYLLKDRVLDPAELADAIHRVGAGGSAIDPVVIEHLVRRREPDGSLASLSPREREVLASMAEGRSNRSIADTLFISEKTVEATIGRVFSKLGLEPIDTEHRRVRAVLAFLRAAQPDL
jgi:serine/threonine-protein kinase